MKKQIQSLLAVLVLMAVGMGCGLIGVGSGDTNTSNKSLTDKAVDTTVGRASTGVPECDQVLDAIETEMNNPDDNFMVKAAKSTVLNRIKDSIRQSIEQNPTDKETLAKTCSDYKAQFDRYKAEQQSNSQ